MKIKFVFTYQCPAVVIVVSLTLAFLGYKPESKNYYKNCHFYLFIYLFPQPEQPQLSQPVYTGEVFQLFDHPWDFPFKPIQKINVFVM